MEHRGIVIRVACKLHNICIDDFGCRKPSTLSSGSSEGFSQETDHQIDDHVGVVYTDGTGVHQGYRSDLERCSHRDAWTAEIARLGLRRPLYSKFSRCTERF